MVGLNRHQLLSIWTNGQQSLLEVTIPKTLGWFCSANMTSVEKVWPSSAIMACPSSVRVVLPSAWRAGAVRSTGTPSSWSSEEGTALKVDRVSTVAWTS